MKKDSKTTLFIEKAKKIHGTIYDYSLVSYVNSKTKVKLSCPIHGVFLQRPDVHLRGSGCKSCGLKNRTTESNRQANFIKKANLWHKGKYDYSLVDYVDSKTKVKIICHEHGMFIQSPNTHNKSFGCQKCAIGRIKNNHKFKKRVTTEQFIKKAKNKHKEKYDYSLVKYLTAKDKVKIICPEHGVFLQVASDHLSGRYCLLCVKTLLSEKHKKIFTTKLFIEKAKKVHSNKYDYSLVEYINAKTRVKIICPIHGEFLQIPHTHLSGCGCKGCKISTIKRKSQEKYNIASFIERANTVHKGKYNYDRVDYINAKTKVKIICPIHGEFLQTPDNHLACSGCSSCRLLKIKAKNQEKYNIVHFIENAKKLHGDKYDYSLVEYINAQTKVKIICPDHGEFLQVPNAHLSGCGCRECNKTTSKAEIAIADYIESLGLTVKRNDRTLIKPLELDIYIPSKKIAIEYNGLYWHTEANGKDKYYHKNKTTLCAEQGVRLIHIWEDDFNQNPERELNFIKHVLGMDNSKTIFARKTTLAQIDNYSAKEFLDKYHVQGFVGSSLYYGHFFDKELVAVTSFTFKKNKTIAELTRHCAKHKVIGSLGKATKLFLKEYNIPVISFCDLTRFNGKSYELAGFVKDSELAPDYKYLVDFTREHKFLWRRKSIQNKLPEFFDTALSEREMMNNAGIERVWDCGKIKFIYNPNNIKLGD